MNYGIPLQKQIIFEGDSLFALKAGTSATSADYGGQYIPISTYNSLTRSRLSYQSKAVEGRRLSQIVTDAPTVLIPYLKKDDIVVLFAGINDITAGTTAAGLLALLQTYYGLVHAVGAKLYVISSISRGDSQANFDVADAYNVLLRNNPQYYDSLFDVGANAIFNDFADSSNTTYYQTDKVHLKIAGSDVFIGIIYPLINALI